MSTDRLRSLSIEYTADHKGKVPDRIERLVPKYLSEIPTCGGEPYAYLVLKPDTTYSLFSDQRDRARVEVVRTQVEAFRKSHQGMAPTWLSEAGVTREQSAGLEYRRNNEPAYMVACHNPRHVEVGYPAGFPQYSSYSGEVLLRP